MQIFIFTQINLLSKFSLFLFSRVRGILFRECIIRAEFQQIVIDYHIESFMKR